MVETIIKMAAIDPGTMGRVNTSLDSYSKTLKKLEDLVESIKELENELKEAQYDYYRNVAEMLADIKEKMSHFDAYGAIPHVILIRSKINAIELELQKHIQWSCREIGQLVSSTEAEGPEPVSSIDLQTLSQLYLVIDVLGVPFRKDLLERFAQLQLIPYEKLFKFGSKFAGLEYLDRRYAWFKRLLSVADERLSSIFPSNWNLPYHLFVEFSRRTTKHVADVLEHGGKDQLDANAHVAGLLKALKSILVFEAEMKTSFDMQTRNKETESTGTKEEVATSGDFIAPTSIAEAFDAYLGPYVQLERQSLEDLMGSLMRDEDISMREDTNGSGISPTLSKEPYGSSHKMFEFIKSSLKRCTAFSTGDTYLSLSKEFRICLQHYAENLRFRCPSPVSAKAGKPPQYVISPSGEQLMSRIVTTGEYCINTVPQLEVMMKKHINSSLCDQIDFSVQIDAFMDMVSFTYSVMTAGITERLEPAMKTMRKTNVTSIEYVGDDSKYVKEISAVLNETIPRIRACMSASYFAGFCMKLVTAVLAKVLESLVQMRHISKTGGGQLLLDLQGIKTYLLRMPHSRLQEGEEPCTISKSYNSLVGIKAQNLERILKLVCTEDDMMEETFKILWPEGKPSDLEAVLALKGSGNAALDQMGDLINVVGVGAVGRGAKGAVGEITQGLKKGAKEMGGGFKGLISGKLFEDGSSHSHKSDEVSHGVHSNGGGGHPHHPTAGGSNTASKALGDMKNVFKSFNVFDSAPPPQPPARKPVVKK
jgi:hypothetical protein